MDTCWRFESLTLNNFRQYEAFEMQFSPDVTLLIGENGAGKTAVLDALAILLSTLLRGKDYGSKSLDHVDARLLPKSLESVYATASVERFYPTAVAGRAVLAGQHFAWERRIEGPQNNSTWGNREVRDFSADMLAQAQKQEPQAGETLLPVIAYYGVERLVGERRKQGTIPTSRLGAYYSTLDPRSDLKRLSMFLESLDKQIVRAHAYGDKEPVAARRQFEAIDAACTEILSPVGWHSLRWNDHEAQTAGE